MTEFLSLEDVGIVFGILGFCSAVAAHIRTRGRYIVFNLFSKEGRERWSQIWQDPLSRPWAISAAFLCGIAILFFMGNDFINKN